VGGLDGTREGRELGVVLGAFDGDCQEHCRKTIGRLCVVMASYTRIISRSPYGRGHATPRTGESERPNKHAHTGPGRPYLCGR
jgi:hypothetical protein